ncbi:hypothetical protein [Sphingobium ummariense]
MSRAKPKDKPYKLSDRDGSCGGGDHRFRRRPEMGRLVKRNALSGLAAPATAALAGQHLYVVNTRFNRMDTNDAAPPFTTSKAPLATATAD